MLPPPPPKIRVFAPDLLAGQTALVTGAGTGLGRAIAQQLAEAGADVVLAARNLERLQQAAAEIRRDTGRRVEAAFVNIRDRATVEALAADVAARVGAIDMLINNAGGQFAQPARDFSPKGWQAVIDTNLTGTWHMTQVFGGVMLARGAGSIVNIIAVIGRGFPGIAHTAAARAGVLELTRTLAIEWGPSVRLNCVAPGPIQTEAFKVTYDPNIDTLCEGIPIARFGGPDEIAYATIFLASPAASWITGEVLYVAGGQQLYGRNQALFDEAFKRG
ncbi:MAG: SDR family oxidoreductase [Deltaproteobacteria bacterium]|nr:SDR family oxidoreductase [Deltaproteobacteria bacterium]